METNPQSRRPALPDYATIEALTGIPLDQLPVLRYGQRRHGFALSSARFAGCDTDLEHGPQTYLGAVASYAAAIEADSDDRATAISAAFDCVPGGSGVFPTQYQRTFVRRVLEAGDHAADLALAARFRANAGRNAGHTY